MRLLIVGTLKGQLTAATKIAMDNGATVTHAEGSDQAMAVLREMAQFGTEGFVFAGYRQGRPLSDITMARAVDAAGGDGATVHGMRSTFRDWVGEMTPYPRELAEVALAHALPNKVEAAYQRGDLLEKRRRLMAEWATFCGRPMVAGEVVQLRTAT